MSSTRHARRPARLRLVALAAIGLALAAVAPLLRAAAPPQPLPTQRVDLRVLVVGNSLASTGAWQAALQREGVPFDARAASTITDATVADYGANRARYQAVIVTTGVPLPTAAAAALRKFETTFGIRRISEIGDTFDPAVYHGIDALTPGTSYADQAGRVGQLTALGLQVFPYLKGPVQIEGPGAFGFQGVPGAVPAPGSFQRLLNGPNGGSYLGIYTDPLDLRQEMVMTVSSNQFQLHNQLLRHGMLNWVTRGVYLGTQRNYLTMNIDDVFLPDALWDPVTNTTPGDASVPTCTLAGAPVDCPEARMTPSDVRDVVAWQVANGFTFDFMFNGQGVEDARDAGGGTDPLTDDPVDGLLANKSEFRWVNHTLTHAQLDLVSLNTATTEITANTTFATANALPGYDPQEIVTGEHSGLGSYVGVLATGSCGTPCPINPNVVSAFNATGIRWAGDDNSAKPNQRPIGNALTVPRYPANIYYNVATRAAQLDEYNWIYASPANQPVYGNCVPSAVTTCRSSLAQWLANSPNGELSYVNSEVGIMFGHLMGNDARPHYAHQSNLITNHFLPGTTTPDPAADGLGILFTRPGRAGEPGVLDALLAKYRTYFAASAPIVQPTFSESGRLLQKKGLWDGHVAQGRASGYLLNGQVHVVASQPMEVPLTGTNVGDVYGGHRSGWTNVVAGDSVFAPADPVNAIAPTVGGTASPGGTLTATTGSWVGTAPISLGYQWQRCSASACVNIAGVVDGNYTIGAIDAGYGLRVVQMAGNWIASVSQAPSNTVQVPGPPPPPGPPPTPPAPGNVPPALTKLTLTNVTVSPRRFRTARVTTKRTIGGTTIRWRLNAIAKVTIVVQRRKGKRWVTVGAIQRDARAGRSAYRFTGKVGLKRLSPGAHRFVISARRPATATGPALRSRSKAITFTFLRGLS